MLNDDRSSVDGVGTVQRIAVATDRSDGGDRAVRWAVELADRSGSALAVIQVLDADGHAEVGSARDALAAELDDRHDRMVLAADDVAEALVDTASKFRSDLLVVGFRSAPVEQAIRGAGRTVGLGMAAGLAWIAASSSVHDRRRRTLNAVAGMLTGAFTVEIVRQCRR